ncbi:WYL domain-containing protein [Nocardioides sp. GY 10113]|uniref:helix-turn-helix transcriptional regulator n=1 Tax=Nocardioides sp. GY 10113 TaxID=2569761 RepID=UPI0010A77746|nr:WYL domain-containing protein [Nocardioides sp. GY 10113]TIC87681.1 WYL domain-containing protein [Nocardioides sp. GY 10113]
MSSRAVPGARDQVARLLTLVPYLHHRPQVRLGEAAELLGTTPGQVLADLRVLFLCGLPGGLPDDLIDVDLDALVTEDGTPLADGLVRVDNADYLARPLRLSPTEASAVTVALHTLRTGSSPETVALVDRVLAKIERAVTAGAEASRGPGPVAIATEPREAELATLAATLQRAADESRQVLLSYHVPSRDELSERVVDPQGVVTHGRFRYLDGWCHLAGGDRLFRLDRITAARVLDSAAETPRRPPRDVTAGAFAERPDTGGVVATLLLAPEASWAVDYYPMRAARPRPDGSLEVDLLVADPQWLDRLLLRLAPHASVLGPPEFAASYERAARATLDRYR